MRWTIVGILILGAVLLVADDSDKGTTRKPGELVLPQKFEAKDYPGDEGNQILLVWGASTGDNTQFEEIEERYKELVKKEASNWKEQIRELVDAVPGARSVFSGLEADLFGRVTSKVRMRLAADVEKEKKVVYELYYSDKRGVPAGERNLLGRVGSNEMTNLVTAKPDLFGKRPKERFAHFFVVDVERVFCSREAERIDELKSMLLGQTRIKDELKGADRERKEIEEERLKLRAMLKLLDEACRGEKAEPYNVAYWLEELIKQMAIVERLGESRQKALDFSIVGEEKLKDASVGERVARAQRNLENALLSLGDVFKNSWLGCYVVKEIEEKMDEMERLLRLQKEEAENLVMMLEENLRRAEEKEKVLKGLSDKSLAPRFIEELRASVAEMYREVQELRMSLEIELGKKSVYAEAAGEAAKRYNSFVVSRSGMLGRIYEAWKRLCEGTPEKAEVLKTGIERIKRTVEESEAEYEKRYEEVVGFALLYRFCA
ncbi:MAG: hypothetical protein N2234_07020, partial [Planctomycetota bacterium]|nr:hypothetical protein [Planctomycetota bacterium]